MNIVDVVEQSSLIPIFFLHESFGMWLWLNIEKHNVSPIDECEMFSLKIFNTTPYYLQIQAVRLFLLFETYSTSSFFLLQPRFSICRLDWPLQDFTKLFSRSVGRYPRGASDHSLPLSVTDQMSSDHMLRLYLTWASTYIISQRQPFPLNHVTDSTYLNS